MGSAVLENGLGAMAFARRSLLGLAEDIPHDKLCHAPTPCGNHTLWILGHLAYADDYFVSQLGGTPSRLSKEWIDQFGQGSKPTPDAESYPSLEEVKKKLSGRRGELERWFRTLSDAELARPLPGEWTQFASTYGVLMSTIAWHEGLHSGQLTVIRKSLGIKPKFG